MELPPLPPPGQIEEKRRQIKEGLRQKAPGLFAVPPTPPQNAHLQFVFGLYDDLFFGGFFKTQFTGTIALRFTGRLRTSAGVTKMSRGAACFEIELSRDFFMQYYAVDRAKPVNGLATADAVDAMLLVLEHELCHVLEYLHRGRSSCKGRYFRQLARQLFGHEDVVHQLPSSREINKQTFHIRPGNPVAFVYQGEEKQGFVAAVNKRATVMVPSPGGEYLDRAGKRYTKYYVAMDELRKL